MAASKQTEKLGLSLWEASDRPERQDFVSDNQALESLLGGHLADTVLHLSATEKNLLKKPFSVLNYTGTGKASMGTGVGLTGGFALVLCADHPPLETDEDGVQHVYWDFWAYRSGGGFGGGGAAMNGSTLYCYSKTVGDRVFHLNDSGCRYTALVFPRL